MSGGHAATVAIIDYDMGNLFSVRRACEYAGLRPVVTADPGVIEAADAIILPGVGAFGDAMESLRSRGLVGPVRKFAESGRPFMGVCLGMQLVFSGSEEFGAHEGLGLVPGRVVRFPERSADGRRVKVPQVGWNRIVPPAGGRWERTPLEGLRPGEYVYFVHSYYAVPADPAVVLSETDYEGTTFCSSIRLGNLFACQFHPEKSAAEGLKIYENLAAMLSGTERGLTR